MDQRKFCSLQLGIKAGLRVDSEPQSIEAAGPLTHCTRFCVLFSSSLLTPRPLGQQVCMFQSFRQYQKMESHSRETTDLQVPEARDNGQRYTMGRSKVPRGWWSEIPWGTKIFKISQGIEKVIHRAKQDKWLEKSLSIHFRLVPILKALLANQ